MKSAQIFQAVRLMSKFKTPASPALKAKGPVFSNNSGDVVLQILAKPGAKSNGITSIDEECVGIQISARPVDGEANTELLKYVMSVLGLKKNEISFERGIKSRQKVLIISKKGLTPEKVLEMLKLEMNE